MKPYGYEHAAFGLDDGRGAASHETDRISGILSRFRTGLGTCDRCRTARATVLLGGQADESVRCHICAGIDRRAVAGADADRARRLRLAEAQFRSSLERPVSARRLMGYIAVYDQPWRRGDGFEETIEYRAFRDAPHRDDIDLVIDHDPKRVIARQADGTLRLREDHFGLFCEADLANTDDVRGVLFTAVRDELGASFAGQAIEDELTQPPMRRRILHRVHVTHLSVSRRDLAAYKTTWLMVDSLTARRRREACEREAVQRRLEAAVSC